MEMTGTALLFDICECGSKQAAIEIRAATAQEVRVARSHGGIGPAPRATLSNIKPYVPGRAIADIRAQFGVERVVKLASNENSPRLTGWPACAPVMPRVRPT